MPTVLECAMMSEDVYHDRLTIVSGHKPVAVPLGEVYCQDEAFAGGAYVGQSGVGIIAMRGSRELEDWRGANLQIFRRQFPIDRFGHALVFFAAAHRALASVGCHRFVVTGHSLGGGLAAVVAATASWVPTRGVTFNAPGLAEFSAREASGRFDHSNAENVFNFRAQADVVSHWGTHLGQTFDMSDAGLHGIRSMIQQLGLVDFGGWEI
jgi:pimeloyl-ACP methyl ester carboxylesterase